MPLIERSQLGPQFRFWLLHVSLTAVPSFFFALMAFNTVMAVAAMLAGIATFVVGYTLLGSSTFYMKMSGASPLGRAVKIGARIRVIISLATAPLLLGFYVGLPLLFFSPDYWAGFGAVAIVQQVASLVVGQRVELMDGSPHFLPTYAVVIAEGLIISFTLVLLVFFSLLVLNRKAARAGV